MPEPVVLQPDAKSHTDGTYRLLRNFDEAMRRIHTDPGASREEDPEPKLRAGLAASLEPAGPTRNT